LIRGRNEKDARREGGRGGGVEGGREGGSYLEHGKRLGPLAPVRAFPRKDLIHLTRRRRARKKREGGRGDREKEGEEAEKERG